MPRDSTSLIPRLDPEVRERRMAAALGALSGGVVFAGSLWWWSGSVRSAAAFTLAIGCILGAHEAGHWVAARAHRVAVGPPLVLPVGVVMRLREPPADRVGLAAIGLSGPVAGLVAMAIVVLARGSPGLAPSEVVLGQPLVLALAGGPPATVYDPMGLAVCLGATITAINLIPWGQLDGGHVLAALLPRRAQALGWGVTALLLGAAFYWPGWAVWAGLVHVAGNRRPLVPRRAHPPAPSRWWAVGALLTFVLCFTPAPIRW